MDGLVHLSVCCTIITNFYIYDYLFFEKRKLKNVYHIPAERTLKNNQKYIVRTCKQLLHSADLRKPCLMLWLTWNHTFPFVTAVTLLLTYRIGVHGALLYSISFLLTRKFNGLCYLCLFDFFFSFSARLISHFIHTVAINWLDSFSVLFNDSNSFHI